jgi:CheY-like chemotaxis protein
MLEMLHREPEFSEMFVTYLLVRNVRYEADLIDQRFNSSEKRLARTLLLLARIGREGEVKRVVPKITQEVLAEMIGTTRSRVSIFMNRFRRLGFIHYNGGLEVQPGLPDEFLRRRSGMRILIADDSDVVRRGVCGILSSQKDLEVCGEAKEGLEALFKARELLPDLILLDISMPGINGLEATRRIWEEIRQAKILVISQHN